MLTGSERTPFSSTALGAGVPAAGTADGRVAWADETDGADDADRFGGDRFDGDRLDGDRLDSERVDGADEELEQPIIRPTFMDLDDAPLSTHTPVPPATPASPRQAVDGRRDAEFGFDDDDEDEEYGAGSFGSGGFGSSAAGWNQAQSDATASDALGVGPTGPDESPADAPSASGAPQPRPEEVATRARRAAAALEKRSGAGRGADAGLEPNVGSGPREPTNAGAPRGGEAPVAETGNRDTPVRGRRRRPAEDEAGAIVSTERPRRRGSLRSKLLSTAILPVILTIVGALAATWFTARPALYDQLLESARNPAIATAATLSSTLERAGGEGIDHLQLLETILITRQAFARQNLSFILATDPEGNPYSGSFLGGTSFPEQSLELQNAVRERAVHAVQQGSTDRTGWAEEGATTTVPAAGGQRIEIVAQPLMSGSTPIGAVVVGVTDQAVTEQVNRIVINVLLFSLVPLLLAILIAAWRARRLTNNVLTLTRKADEISRGDLDEPVDVRSNDELDDLSAALERMRVSMSGALERLRRRR